jgi:glycosyltransferase involved in cell wall biosynthesis
LTFDDLSDLRVAIPHYWFVTWRGGEKVVRALLDLFPRADLYTLFYDPTLCGEYLSGHQVYRSKIDIPFLRARHQKVFPLYPSGVRSLELQDTYDFILSSESGPIKGIANPDGIPHLSYVHSPMRYCWGFTEDYVSAVHPLLRPVVRSAFRRLRDYDLTTTDNVDHYVANSFNVQNRIHRHYNRASSVVHPPIALELFDKSSLCTSRSSSRTHYLSFGAITPYKGINLLVEAFNKSGKPLVIVGEGSERKRLQAIAQPNIIFTGARPYAEIQALILQSKALIFPGEEDFGMIPLEVMAHGVPVIAYKRGGALETVQENLANPKVSTGIFFDYQHSDQIEAALEKFERCQDEFDPDFIRSHARRFGEDHFKERMREEIGAFLSRARIR